jgi:hypothetical protein
MPVQFQNLREVGELYPRQSIRWRTTGSLLCALPTELIEQIAGELNKADIGSLRLVCRTLSHNTSHLFGLVCLTTVRTHLSQSCLQKLEELSRHEQFRYYVQTLHIVDYFRNGQADNDLGQGFSWDRSPSGRLEFPNRAVQILQDLLLKLENCHSLHIHVNEWGWGTECLSYTDVLAIVLHIIAEASLPITSLILESSRMRKPARLDLQTYQTPKFKCAWAQLQRLSLLHTEVELQDFDWIVGLVSDASGLKSLSLVGGSPGSDPYLDQLSSSNKLPRLQELDLRCAHRITFNALSRFLLRFSDSLRVLKLSDCSTLGPWEPFFKLLRDDFPLLNTLSLYMLSEVGDIMWVEGHQLAPCPGVFQNLSPSGDHHRGFKITHQEKVSGELRSIGISYTGQEMSAALDMLIESIT